MTASLENAISALCATEYDPPVQCKYPNCACAAKREAQARAVIESLMEPSADMFDAAWDWTQSGSTSEQRMATALGGGKQVHAYKMYHRWQAMLKRFLEEGE